MPLKTNFSKEIILTLIVSLCGVAQLSHAEDQPFSIYGNLTTIEIAPVLVVKELGLFDEPSVVKMGGVPNLSGRDEPGAFWDAGTADVATNAETQLLRYSVDNPDARIILTVSEGLYRIVAKKSSGINSLADLKGKKIATIRNTSSNYFLHRMLSSVGLTDADVEIVSTWPMDLYKTALTEGGFDAITVWEPGADYAALSIDKKDVIEFKDKKIYREVFNLNTTAAALADPKRRAQIVKYVRALILASQKIATNPEIAWPLVAKSASLPEKVVEQVWHHHTYPAILVDDMLDVLVAEEQWLAADAKRTPRSREELAKLIDPSVYAEALKSIK